MFAADGCVRLICAWLLHPLSSHPLFKVVGRVGFEPTTNWLKANCSTD